ncbi:hypothetical protein L596_000210 [Steinernema carpocapsae]|uniref:glucuronosyltransferase n=1 Tax=Steinernema carpocapsae TaxID=34508 RepID=A0A4U8UIJ5_STECR|nr:hypothetical protein L596_000210 [Steinernema carpocapsae]
MTVDLLKLKSNPRAPRHGKPEEIGWSTLPSDELTVAPDVVASATGHLVVVHEADSVGRPATMNRKFLHRSVLFLGSEILLRTKKVKVGQRRQTLFRLGERRADALFCGRDCRNTDFMFGNCVGEMRVFQNSSFLLSLITLCSSYKFFIYTPTLGHSHVNFMGKIADLLVDAGHYVVVLIPIHDPDVHSNGTTKAHRVIRFEGHTLDKTLWRSVQFKGGKQFDPNAEIMSKNDLKIMYTVYHYVCKDLINDDALIESLRAEKFDVGITEKHDYCEVGLFETLGIKTTIITSAVPFYYKMQEIVGLQHSPFIEPSIFTSFSDEMTYMERLRNIMRFHMYRYFIDDKNIAARQSIFREKFGADFPGFKDLEYRTTAIIFVNSLEMLEFARPISHKIIYMGGLGLAKPKALTGKFLEISQSAKKGVVLLSLGSIVKSTDMPHQTKLAFLEAIARFPEYNFIWKYDNPEDEILKNHSNLYATKWVPQVDVLANSKTKAFLTHCGLNSVTESVFFGKPILALPIFADQPHNAAFVQKRKVGYYIKKGNLTAESIEDAFRAVLGDGKTKTIYTQNAERMRDMIKERPFTSEQLVLRWTEYVAKFGALPEMNIYTREMQWYQTYMLDIYGPILLTIIVLIASILATIRKIVRVVLSLFESKAKKD